MLATIVIYKCTCIMHTPMMPGIKLKTQAQFKHNRTLYINTCNVHKYESNKFIIFTNYDIHKLQLLNTHVSCAQMLLTNFEFVNTHVSCSQIVMLTISCLVNIHVWCSKILMSTKS